MIQVFLLFRGKWTVAWRKKIYTDSQHNMQKNNIKITCQSLAHWVKSPKQASEIWVWTSSFWFKSHEMSNRLLHGFILHISSITHNIPVSTSYDIRQWPTCIHELAFSHYECWIAGIFSSKIQFVNSCKSNTLHCVLVLSQSEHNVIQMLLSSDDVHIWTLYCYHMTSHPVTCLYTREGHHCIPVSSGCLPVSRSSRTVAGSSQSFHGHAPSLW